MRLFVVVCLVACAITVACAGCSTDRGDDVLDIVYDPCERLDVVPAADASADEIASVEDATAMWNEVAGTRLFAVSPSSTSPFVPVRFEEAAPLFHGVYEDEIGVIIINRALEDRRARAITIAHELGHAFGLWHEGSRASVMNAANLELEPNADDARALAELWGDCASR